MSHHDWVHEHTLLRVEVGSGVHGIAQEGRDDRDEMGVCLEPYELAQGLTGTFEQHIHRDAAVRDGRHDAPSMPGDLDLTIYSLRKWCRLALKGNPTVLTLLFSPTIVGKADPRGMTLRSMAPLFASKQAGAAFLGYLQAQRQRLLGERGQKNVNRRDLVEKYGFDTKYAGHMLRLGYQGIEFMQTGKLTLPMPEPQRARVIAVRQGRVMLGEVLTETGQVEQELADLQTTSPLPERANTAAVEDWMLETYHEHWKATWGHERHLTKTRQIWAGKTSV